jgi:hypothetical protein
MRNEGERKDKKEGQKGRTKRKEEKAGQAGRKVNQRIGRYIGKKKRSKH